MEKYNIWDGTSVEEVVLEYYPTNYKACKAAVICLPGGGYFMHSDYEGSGYAQIFNMFGMDAFVLNYRVAPNRFPAPLEDARRAVRFIRANMEKFEIDKDKILVIGSSAGGHLAALLSTYKDELENEGVDQIDKESYLPNGQILCYPVISSEEDIWHEGSYCSLLGDGTPNKEKVSPNLLVIESTPKAFIWHTSTDDGVNVMNSYRYAEALARHNIPCEMHIFPVGGHGLGAAANEFYVSRWIDFLRAWLKLNNFINCDN